MGSVKRRRVLTAFIGVLVAGWLVGLLVGCAATGNEDSIKKQLALTPEQKLQFDRVFFNEIWLWNQTSWRYGNPPSGPKRQKEFESMAAQGYLPAYVALKMFNFDKKTKRPDKAAFELLRQAADAGDVSSTCALVPIWAWNDIEGYPRDLTWAVSYIERGTAAGHFACLTQMAGLYRKGILVSPGRKEERRLLLMAAEAGDTRAFQSLEVSLLKKDKPWHTDSDRAMCWHVAQTLYSPFTGIDFGFYRAASQGAYPQLELTAEQRAEAQRLADKWEGRMKSAKVIMDIVNECLILEREKLNGND